MRRTRWGRSWRRVLLLAPLALVLTGCSADQWERNLRFGFPTGATREATRIRVLYTWTGVTALALGVVVWGLIFWACLRYRRRKTDPEIPRQTKYNFVIEMTCLIFPFIIIAGLFWRTVVVEDDVNHLSKNPDVTVQVDAFKWNWQFEYHGYRGMTGQQLADPTVEAYANATTGQTLTNPEDADQPADQRRPFYLRTTGTQYEIPVLVIPVGQTVQFIEHSQDVLHSFWVPEFLFKRDVVPYGSTSTERDNKFEITATKTGHFVGRCAELCGVYHSQMNFEVRVVSQQQFVNYMAALKRIGPDDPAAQAKALREALPGQSPYATTTYPFDTDPTSRQQSERNGS